MEQSYKEKYEDILARLERAKNDNEVCDERYCCVIDDLIPELAESEDEKVRKEIINYFQCQSEEEPTRKEIHDKWIAWLEKQGLKSNPYSGVSFNYNGNTWGMCARDNGVDILFNKKLMQHISDEKQEIFGKKDVDDAYLKGVRDTKNEIEKQYEANYQTRKDIATFIFNYKGDIKDRAKWIDYLGIKVSFVGEQGEQKPTDTVEPKFKVGDKIYLKQEYRMPDDDTPIANTVKEIRRIDDKHYRFDGSYIFIEDQDKYELVEQKPKENKGNLGGISANSAWSEEDEQRLNSCLNILQPKTFVGNTETINTKWLKSLKDRVQPKQEWTEEEIEPIISDYLCGREHYGGMIGRLCHLKPKQKQTEWGENDKAFLDDILCKLEHDLILNKDEKDWLKSLRPQNRWKPSDEQISLLQAIINEPNNAASESCQIVLKDILEQLKKLKESKV